MSVIAFTVWESEIIGPPPGLVAGLPTIALSSAPIANPGGQLALRIVVNYESLTPNNNDGGPGGSTYELAVVVETQDDAGRWDPLAYQFSSSNRTDSAPKREIIMQPDIASFDAGIDEPIFVGSSELARISRQQGILPTTSFRVSLYVTEYDPGGANAFTSATVSVTGERYDVA